MVVDIQKLVLGVFYHSEGLVLSSNDFDGLKTGAFSCMIVLEEEVNGADCEGSQSILYRFGEYSKFKLVSYSEEDGFDLNLVGPVIVERV